MLVVCWVMWPLCVNNTATICSLEPLNICASSRRVCVANLWYMLFPTHCMHDKCMLCVGVWILGCVLVSGLSIQSSIACVMRAREFITPRQVLTLQLGHIEQYMHWELGSLSHHARCWRFGPVALRQQLYDRSRLSYMAWISGRNLWCAIASSRSNAGWSNLTMRWGFIPSPA